MTKLLNPVEAGSNGFQAAPDILIACKMFLTEMPDGYRHYFSSIKPLMALRTSGIILHKLLEFRDEASNEKQRVNLVLQLVNHLMFHRSGKAKPYAPLVVAEYIEFLRHRNQETLGFALDQLITEAEHRPKQCVMKRMWSEASLIKESGDYGIFEEVFQAVKHKVEPRIWFSAHVSQRVMINAYEASQQPEIRASMNRWARGHVLEQDLGM